MILDLILLVAFFMIANERKREFALLRLLGTSRKKLGGVIRTETVICSLLGGILGAVLGFAFAQVVSVNVFGSSITFQPLLLPAAVIVSMGVAALSCLQPIKRAVAIDPAIVLKDE